LLVSRHLSSTCLGASFCSRYALRGAYPAIVAAAALAVAVGLGSACSSNGAATGAPTAASAPAQPGASRAAPAVPTTAGGTPDRPFGPRTKETGCLARDGLQDRACTPGAILPAATAAEICRSGYSSAVRDVPSQLKQEVYRSYQVVERTAGEYEVDHLVSLELGGSNDIANLWPEAAEPRPGFHEKDQVENFLHEQVCRGATPLAEAQRTIATDWLSVYRSLPASVRKP